MTKEKVINILNGIKYGTACLMPNMPEDGEKAIDIAIKAVEQPEPHWIPVTERLPEINEDILLSYFDEVTLGWLCGDGSWMIFDGQECVGADEVSAWMPLPEPYKGVINGRD